MTRTSAPSRTFEDLEAEADHARDGPMSAVRGPHRTLATSLEGGVATSRKPPEAQLTRGSDVIPSRTATPSTASTASTASTVSQPGWFGAWITAAPSPCSTRACPAPLEAAPRSAPPPARAARRCARAGGSTGRADRSTWAHTRRMHSVRPFQGARTPPPTRARPAREVRYEYCEYYDLHARYSTSTGRGTSPDERVTDQCRRAETRRVQENGSTESNRPEAERTRKDPQCSCLRAVPPMEAQAHP